MDVRYCGMELNIVAAHHMISKWLVITQQVTEGLVCQTVANVSFFFPHGNHIKVAVT